MLANWDPFREMMTMRRAVDRLIENSVGRDDWSQTSEWDLPLDVVEDENTYLVKASVPGIKPEDLEITFDKGMLTIRGEIKDESEITKGQYHLRERRFGTFTRTINLPTSVNVEKIKAKCEEGILALEIPKSEEVKPKRIEIQSGDGQKMIDAKNK